MLKSVSFNAGINEAFKSLQVFYSLDFVTDSLAYACKKAPHLINLAKNLRNYE